MNNILNISSKNSYLTSKQWEEVVEYVESRSNIVEKNEETILEEQVEEIIEEQQPKMFTLKSVARTSSTPTGTILSSSGGTLTSGKYYLNGHTQLTANIIITGEVTIDLNGFVLSGTGNNNMITCNGYLTIKDSNPQRINYGTLNENGVWIFSNGNSGTVIYGGVITNKGAGKGIAVNNTCTIEGGTIAGCIGTFGSAITISSSGKFYMTGGKILYNYTTSTTYGGAIYGEMAHSNTGAIISLSNAEVSYNSSLGGGGAIYGYKVTLSNTNITHNNAAKYGGGIYITNDDAVGDNAYLNVSNNSSINNNWCAIYGGGVYCAGDFTLTNSAVNHNICGADESDIETGKLKNQGRGGGIFLSQSKEGKTSHSIFENVEIKYNKAMYYGGAIQTGGENTLLVFNSGEISENEAFLGGAGAVHITSSSTFTINGGRISNNTCEGRGGAIHSAYGCTVNLNSGTIENNTVYGRGAGVHVNVGGIINLTGTVISGNKAYSVYRTKFCKLENKVFTKLVTGEEIFEEGIGGGVVIDGGEFNMTQGNILNNYAEVAGGGVALIMYSVTSGFDNKVVKFNISNGNILGNSTDGDGGGVYLMRNTFSELDPEEYPNITEELRNGIPRFTATGGVISNNFAQNSGGAAYLETNTQCYISGNVIINENNSVNLGGAIYIDEGTMYMDGGVLDKNTSQSSGGAIYVFGDVNIDSGEITNNIALGEGGAIVVASGDLTIGLEECYNTGNSSTHSHPIIEGNIASDGGGIYVDGGTTTMWCGDIKHNLTHEKTVNVLVVSGGNFTYNGGTIGVPYDSGVFVQGGVFEDNTSEINEVIKHELYYHSVLDDVIYNGKIPESKWITSPRGDILHKEDCDNSSPTWADLFPNYEFVGWENNLENDTNKIVNLYAIWEER